MSLAIQPGRCACGCGQTTNIAQKTNRSRGQVIGQPMRYRSGHGTRRIYVRPDLSDAAPFRIDGVYCRLIPLTRGMYAIVDASDYEWLSEHKWTARWDKSTGGYYAVRTFGSANIRMHREILGLAVGDSHEGEHRNTVSLDNRRANLRQATKAQNMQNMRLRKTNSSGFKGVSWHAQSSKWRAEIRANGQHFSLGLFETQEAAHEAYKAASLLHHGPFGRVA